MSKSIPNVDWANQLESAFFNTYFQSFYLDNVFWEILKKSSPNSFQKES
jgi:hypothetical protein